MNLESHDFFVNLTIFQNATHNFGYLGVGRSESVHMSSNMSICNCKTNCNNNTGKLTLG